MKFDEFMKRKREGNLPRIRIPSDGFARIDGWLLGAFIIIAVMEFCRVNGWIG